MTEPRSGAVRQTRRRPHPAATSRIVAAGLAGTAAFGMVAAMALPGATPAAGDRGVAPAGAADQRTDGEPITPAGPVPTPSLAPAPATSSSGS